MTPRPKTNTTSVGAGIVLVALLGGVLWFTRGPGAQAIAPAPPTVATVTATQAPSVAQPLASSAAPATSAPPSAASSTASGPATTRARPAVTKPPVPRPSTKSCNPPYDVDSSGRRIFKVECL